MRCIIVIARATTWKYIAPIQKAAWRSKAFEYDTWGGEVRPEFEPKPGEIVATEHWCSSGFANTDLDLQLKKQGIQQLIVIGLIAHTCVEATVRFAAELGYDVTVVKDATADYSDEIMHAALDINIPNYASAIVTADEVVSGRRDHYVLEGSLEYQVEGKPPVTLKAGDVLFTGAVHSAKNVGSVNSAELATYVVEKGKPLVRPAE
jgi:hypothetical protein